MTDRVQFREDEDVIAFVESLGLNPNEVAREAWTAQVRKLRTRAKFAKLKKFDVKLAPGESARLVREDRDSH